MTHPRHGSDRRVRRVRVFEENILDMVWSIRHGYGDIVTRITPGCRDQLPKDWRVQRVYFEMDPASFVFVVWSETFSEVPGGEVIPYLEETTLTFETVRVPQDLKQYFIDVNHIPSVPISRIEELLNAFRQGTMDGNIFMMNLEHLCSITNLSKNQDSESPSSPPDS